MRISWGSKPAGRLQAFIADLEKALPTSCYSLDPFERRLYGRDLAPVPEILNRLFYRPIPDVVLMPEDTLQARDMVRLASRHKVALTPRAAATTSYGNSVAVRGGAVLDVSRLNAAPFLDEKQGVVRAGPAVTWSALDESLRRRGWAVRSYPSSAIASTIGGWISTQGHGLGSLKYGALVEQLVSLEVILPDGELHSLTRESQPPLDWFAGSEGTLGLITMVELTVRLQTESEEVGLLAYRDLKLLGQEALWLAQADPTPFTIFFADSGYLKMSARAGFTPSTGLDEHNIQGFLLAVYQGDTDEAAQGRTQLDSCQGVRLGEAAAQEEWAGRLYHLRLKRSGPSLLAAELWLPLEQVGAYLESLRDLSQKSGMLIGTYGLVVSGRQAVVMSLYPCSESRHIEYLMALGFTRRLHKLGMRHGGRPYGVGLWNTPYLPQIFNREELATMRQRKAALDPHGFFNPGKLYQAEFPLWPAAFGFGAQLLEAGYRTMGRKTA